MKEPRTLQQAIQFFSDPDNCISYMLVRRWPDGVACPTCGRKDVRYISTRRMWECKDKHPKRQFSIKIGTIFEDSAIAIDKWLVAMWMVANCRNGVSSYEIARTIGVTQKSAWFMLHRIRLAMQDNKTTKAGGGGGEVECDEAWVGGKVKNMHRSKRLKLNQATNSIADYKRTFSARYGNKVPVMGILDRASRTVRAKVIPNVRRDVLQGEVLKNIHYGAKVYTDQAQGYAGLAGQNYAHEIVNHLERYVDGRVHTNGLENFWSLMKRSLSGTYVAVEPFHLSRYVDEQVFRYNNRKDSNRNPISDSKRFDIALSGILGKRLTYAEVTGKVGATPF